MALDRAGIIDRVAQSQADVDQAEVRAYADEALEWVTRQDGLWYAPLVPDRSVWVVGLDGVLIGQLWHDPAEPYLSGWTCGSLDAGERLGPFRLPRRAAAELVRRLPASPS